VRLVHRAVASARVPRAMRPSYIVFAWELLMAQLRPPKPDYNRRAGAVVMKWFRRGLSGSAMAVIGRYLTGHPRVFGFRE